MAEGGTVSQLTEETHNEPQECPICYSEFTDPRLLDCSHAFCLKCLQELKQAQNRDGKNITCPLCRKQTDLPEDEVDSLQKSHQSEEGTSQGKLPVEGPGAKVMCQSCEEENEAISRCLDCEHFLCQECQKAHLRLAALKTHKIAALAELDSHGKLKDNIPKCEKHADEELCFYCNSCDVLICKLCTTFEHQKPMHFYDSIDQAFSKCTQEIDKLMSQAKTCLTQFTSANPFSIDHSRYRLSTMLRKTKIQITLKAEEEIEKIRKKEQQLKREAEGIVAKRDQEFAYAKTTEQIMKKVNAVIATGSSYEVLKAKQKLLCDIKQQVEIYQTLLINHGMSFLGFKESENDGELGTLMLKEEWGADNKFYSKLNYVKMKNGLFVVLDNPEVNVFSKEGNFLYQFTPNRDSSSTPTCLAVGDSNMIAVGYKDKEEISLHNPDGSLIRTLPAPLIDKHLTISNQRLIYTITDKCKLIAVTMNGKNIFTVNTEKTIAIDRRVTITDYPCGLCCDEAGDIYVVFHQKIYKYNNDVTHKHSIQHYSAQGKYIESWEISNASGPTPYGISFTPEGRLQVQWPK